MACGFGLAAELSDAGGVAVAFFGDGAVNEGMLMESLNLAAVWAADGARPDRRAQLASPGRDPEQRVALEERARSAC